MDSNSKLGRHFIPLDPHEQSANAKVLAGIIERNNLVVANGLNAKCVGAITRRRVTSKSTEESIIDHVIISCDIEEYLESILIDEEGHHSLTKKFKNKNGLITRKSDHNTILSKFNFTWKRNKTSNRIQMYNSKNDDLNEATNIFLKKLEENIKVCLRK